MSKKKYYLLIIVLSIVGLISFYLYQYQQASQVCTPPGQNFFYCNNSTGEITQKVGNCPENQLGRIYHNFCPGYFETEKQHYWRGKRTSKANFKQKITAKNKSCGGCVVRVNQPVR